MTKEGVKSRQQAQVIIIDRETRIVSCGLDDCQSPLLHVDMDSMFKSSSINTSLIFEPVRTKEYLHTLI